VPDTGSSSNGSSWPERISMGCTVVETRGRKAVESEIVRQLLPERQSPSATPRPNGGTASPARTSGPSGATAHCGATGPPTLLAGRHSPQPTPRGVLR
jgi:hypothetical protein